VGAQDCCDGQSNAKGADAKSLYMYNTLYALEPGNEKQNL